LGDNRLLLLLSNGLDIAFIEELIGAWDFVELS
jgi:hypothetical protein